MHLKISVFNPILCLGIVWCKWWTLKKTGFYRWKGPRIVIKRTEIVIGRHNQCNAKKLPDHHVSSQTHHSVGHPWRMWKIQNKYFSINLIASVPSFASCRDWFWHRWIGGYLPPKVVQNRCARIQGIHTYSLYGKQILKVVFCGTIHYNLKARLHLDKNLLQKSLLLTNQCWPCVHEAQIARRPRRDVRSFSFFSPVWH